MRLAVMSAAGNSFALLDALAGAPADPAALAREVCADHAGELFARALAGGLERPPDGRERALDGLLLARPPRGRGDVRMVIHNADGTRPEACGNGLRCLARFARERGLVARDAMGVETDAGTRRVELLRKGGEIVGARASMGPARVCFEDEELETAGARVRATHVELGNPHCVVFVDDERGAPLENLGPTLEHHARFPAGANVELVAARAGRLFARVWERGVGETAACGTGACAVALAAARSGRGALPMEVELPGGRLVVGVEPPAAPSGDAQGEVWLEGPCLLHAEGEWVRGAASVAEGRA